MIFLSLAFQLIGYALICARILALPESAMGREE